MLTHTLEFLRIADTQPGDEKVRRRRESATTLVAHICKKDQYTSLLDLVQGIVGGFQAPVFNQQSPSVASLVNAIQTKDATLPNDLTENAVELRALAGIAVGEILSNHASTETAILGSLALRSALTSRANASEKHLRWILETLLGAADKVIDAKAKLRRRRCTSALDKLDALEEPTDPEKSWSVLRAAVADAVNEAHDQEQINREELEILWWMFAARSDVARTPLIEIDPPVTAAFCCGLELAQRALLPPPASALGMVKRAAESGRDSKDLGSVSFKDAAMIWIASDAMIQRLCPAVPDSDEVIRRYPAILPVSWVCHQLRETKDATKLGKDVADHTGIPASQKHSPSGWGTQVFQEAILQRAIRAAKEA